LPAQIYKLTVQMLEDESYFQEILCKNMKNNYYWSENWSDNFYIKLAKKGFISTSYDTKDGLVLLPELQYAYSILDFKNLHISKKVKTLMRSDDHGLCFNTRFDEVITRFAQQHKHNWLKDNYAKLMNSLYKNKEKYKNFKVTSIELISKKNNELIAGEIGYSIGKVYTSLSGFSSKEKRYNNHGTLQLVLLAKHLQEKGFDFWNLGHPHMTYKQKLGSITYTRQEFLNRDVDSVKFETIKIG